MEIEVRVYTKELVQDVLDFEARLRKEEDFWGWEIDEKYIDSVKKSFDDPAFDHSLSLLAYVDDKVVGRIDSSIIASHFDGSKKAYLDWICVIKSYRHSGVTKLVEATNGHSLVEAENAICYDIVRGYGLRRSLFWGRRVFFHGTKKQKTSVYRNV